MPVFEILCLANSRKRSGRCMAGLRTDGGGWIRPVAWNPEGVLQAKHYTFADGREAQPLDIVRVTCSLPRPQPHHPEDWLLEAQKVWELVSRPAPESVLPLLKASLVSEPEILGDTSDRFPYETIQATHHQHSLALVLAQNPRWIVKQKPGGERRYRLAFTQNGQPYNLALTESVWEERLKTKPPGEYTAAALGLPEMETPLLTISLSEPFPYETYENRHCYKLVAAVQSLPQAWLDFLQGRTVPVAKLSEHQMIVKATHFRAYERWSADEEALLIHLYGRGDSIAEIAELLCRQPNAVQSRLEKLALAKELGENVPTAKTEVYEMQEKTIRVVVCGAAGRMGREVVRAVTEADGLEIVAAIDRQETGKNAGELAGVSLPKVVIENDLAEALVWTKPDVLVDFTLPSDVMANVRVALASGVSPVIGTTGLSAADLEEIDTAAKAQGIGAFVAPNFAIGAVLMMEFAAQAAKYLPDVEIIELHHEKKLDSPSGTALLTAKKIAEAREQSPIPAPSELVEKLPGARGADYENIAIHSVRLPGYVAHQEVLFGGLGQTLVIRHDSLDRRSFMPGVVLAVRKVRALHGLIVGLEKLL